MARFYIAGRYERRAEFLVHASVLAEFNHVVTSDWILGKHEGRSQLEWAMEDLAALRDSEYLLYFSDRIVSRSRFVEWGIALGLGLKLIVIGDNRETPFHMFPRVHTFRTWMEFREKWLEESLAISQSSEAPQPEPNTEASITSDVRLEMMRYTTQPTANTRFFTGRKLYQDF